MRWMQASASVDIERPIEQVWELASGIERMPEWTRGVSEPRMTSEGGMALGATFVSKYTHRDESFDVDYEVTEYDPPRRRQISSLDGPFPFTGTLTLEAIEGGTRVTNAVRAGSDALITSVMFVLLRPLLRRGMRNQLQRELENLRALVEGPADAASEAASETDEDG